VETCSLTLQRDDLSVANLISSGLFGDGAAAVLVACYALAVTWLILKVLDRFERVRVPDNLELEGLDMEMGEQYVLG